MARRFTGPVRFEFTGNRVKAMSYRGIARKMLDEFYSPVPMELGMKRAGRKIKLPDGTIIAAVKSHGVHLVRIHVPEPFEEEEEFAGLIVYPYLGWYWPDLISKYNDGSSAGLTDPELVDNITSYSPERVVSWQPPYYTSNGIPIEGDGKNPGTLKPLDPSYPRRITGSGTVGDPEDPVTWKHKYIITEGAETFYDPTNKYTWSENARGNTIAGDSDYEKYYKTTWYWNNKDLNLLDKHTYTLHWNAGPAGDRHFNEQAQTGTGWDWFDPLDVVFVNGKPYETPAPVGAAAVYHDTVTGSDYLVVCSAYDNLEGTGEIVQGYNVFACLIVRGKTPDRTVVHLNTALLSEAIRKGDPIAKQYAADWYSYTTYVEGSTLGPAVATNRTYYGQFNTPPGWDANNGVPAEYWRRYIYSAPQQPRFNMTGNKLAVVFEIEGTSASEWNELNISFAMEKFEIDDKFYYTGPITVGLNDSGYGKFSDLMHMDRYSDTPTVHYNWDNTTWNQHGTIVMTAGYTGDTLQLYQIKLESKASKVDQVLSLGQNFWCPSLTVRVTHTVLGVDYVIETTRTTYNPTGNTITTNGYTFNAEIPLYIDFNSGDKVIEKVTSGTMSGFETTYTGSYDYERLVYVDGILQEENVGDGYTDSGSVSWTDGTSYPARPNAYYKPWLTDGTFTLDVELGHRLHPVWLDRVIYYDDVHPADDERLPNAYAVFQPGWGHLMIHRGHPKGYLAGRYIKRSVNAQDSGIYYYPIAGSDEERDYRIRPTYFISGDEVEGGRQFMEILNIQEHEDAESALVQVIDVIYYTTEKPTKVVV